MTDKASAWSVLCTTLGIQAAASLSMVAVPVMGSELARALALPVSLIGVYVALAYAAAMLSSLAGGAAIARWGAIRVSQGCLVLAAAGLALSAVPVWAATAAGSVLVGLGYGAVTPASSHLLVGAVPQGQMSLLFSVKQTGVPLGGVLAGAAVPALVVTRGWQQALLAVALVAVTVALLVQARRNRWDRGRNPQHPLVLGSLAQPLRLVMSQPALRTLALCSFAFSIVQLSLITYLVVYLHLGLGYGLVLAGALLAVSQGAGALGRLGWGWVADRWLGAPRTLMVLALTMALAALSAALLQAQAPLPVVILVLFVFGASAIGWNGVFLAEVARQAPVGVAGMATGGTLAVTYLGVVVGPPAFGVLTRTPGGYRLGFLALAALMVLCLAVMVHAGRRGARAVEEVSHG